MKFNERIRNLREDNDLTQKELAEIFNTTQKKISRMETAEAEPSLKDIEIYCKFFKVSADYLLGFTDDQKAIR